MLFVSITAGLFSGLLKDCCSWIGGMTTASVHMYSCNASEWTGSYKANEYIPIGSYLYCRLSPMYYVYMTAFLQSCLLYSRGDVEGCIILFPNRGKLTGVH